MLRSLDTLDPAVNVNTNLIPRADAAPFVNSDNSFRIYFQ
ncbi:hypothetical protein OKW38_005901 [Paraburkholderia sp. MM5496-R1]